MKIVQAFDQTTPKVSGYSMRSRYISESLHKMGIDVTAVRGSGFIYDKADEEINGVSYRSSVTPNQTLAKLPVLRHYAYVSALKKKLEQVISDTGADVLDAHSSLLNGLAVSSVAKKHNKPFIYQIRALWEDAAVDQGKTSEGSLRYNLTRKMETRLIHKASHVTVICDGLKQDLLSRGISEEKITVIPNGVETGKFMPMAKSEEINQKYQLQDCKVIGFIGTFFVFEGLDLLIEATRALVKQDTSIRVVLVGAGLHDEYLKSLVAKYGLESHVIFTGRVDHDDVLKYYSIMDVLVYPRISKRITELVTPLKPLEALSMKKMVIGSDVGGIRELITDGENGLLFKAHDVEDLAAKCLYALDNRQQLQPMIERGRLYVEQERNWPTICQKYNAIFKQLGIL